MISGEKQASDPSALRAEEPRSGPQRGTARPRGSRGSGGARPEAAAEERRLLMFFDRLARTGPRKDYGLRYGFCGATKRYSFMSCLIAGILGRELTARTMITAISGNANMVCPITNQRAQLMGFISP